MNDEIKLKEEQLVQLIKNKAYGEVAVLAKEIEVLNNKVNEKNQSFFTEREQRFRNLNNSDILKLLTSNMLAYDEYEGITSTLFRRSSPMVFTNKHIDGIYGNGLSETKLAELVEKKLNGEDISKELAASLVLGGYNRTTTFYYNNDEIEVSCDNETITLVLGKVERTIPLEELGYVIYDDLLTTYKSFEMEFVSTTNIYDTFEQGKEHLRDVFDKLDGSGYIVDDLDIQLDNEKISLINSNIRFSESNYEYSIDYETFLKENAVFVRKNEYGKPDKLPLEDAKHEIKNAVDRANEKNALIEVFDRLTAEKREITSPANIISDDIQQKVSENIAENTSYKMYVIPDLMTWATNSIDRTPIEYYDSFEKAKERFIELRNQPYNSEKVPFARLTMGVSSNIGDFDIVHVRENKNVLVTDFTHHKTALQDSELMSIFSQISNEIGFDTVMVHRQLENGQYSNNIEYVSFDEWETDFFIEKNIEIQQETSSVDYNEVDFDSLEYFENKGVDFKITVPDELETTFSPKRKFKGNVDAIRMLKQIESENRAATVEEQQILSVYVGWGGLSNAFDNTKQEWADEYAELRELLTDEEYYAASASTNTAFYTSPIVIEAMYSALENMGFKGGKVIDTSMGVGNFFGVMPDEMKKNSELTGVEIDNISGRIAKLLYPSADIKITPFEKTDFDDNEFDIAISNIPFGDIPIRDKKYGTMLIHDYFFEKAIDKVHAGGIVAFVTSKGTMDRKSLDERQRLANRAELLGAIRLPNNAFRGIGNTNATTDIVFLKKRERPIQSKDEWIYRDFWQSNNYDENKNTIAVNSYFVQNPHMVLGNMAESSNIFDSGTTCIDAPYNGTLKNQLANAIKYISGEYNERDDIPNVLSDKVTVHCPPNTKPYTYVILNDNVYLSGDSDTMTLKSELSDSDKKRIIAMCDLRDDGYALLSKQLDDNFSDEEIDAFRKQLNDKYDEFVIKYGRINDRKNSSLFATDITHSFLESFEKLDSKNDFVGKNDILEKRIVGVNIEITHADTAEDALVLSLNEKLEVNFEYMSTLTGKTTDELLSELEDVLYQNPENEMKWETADEYLTGDVRHKLKIAEENGLERNVQALTAVLPEWIGAEDIKVNLGSPLIKPVDIEKFMCEIIGCVKYDLNVDYCELTNEWKIKYSRYSSQTNEIYGTKDKDAAELIEACLNSRDVVVK